MSSPDCFVFWNLTSVGTPRAGEWMDVFVKTTSQNCRESTRSVAIPSCRRKMNGAYKLLRAIRRYLDSCWHKSSSPDVYKKAELTHFYPYPVGCSRIIQKAMARCLCKDSPLTTLNTIGRITLSLQSPASQLQPYRIFAVFEELRKSALTRSAKSDQAALFAEFQSSFATVWSDTVEVRLINRCWLDYLFPLLEL